MDKTWKREERQVAKALFAKRKLRKGTDEKEDIDMPLLSIDVKVRQQWQVHHWFKELKKTADKYNKIPVLVLRKPREHLRIAVIPFDLLVALLKAADIISDNDNGTTSTDDEY